MRTDRRWRGRVHRRRWTILRRACQFGVLAAFVAGPWFGVWVLRGSLASSTVLDALPLTDPFVALQSLAAGHRLGGAALGGAVLVAVVYWLLGGRSFCAWVCPINPVTDAAAWLRRRLGLRLEVRRKPDRRLRLGVMLAVLGLSAISGSVAWEVVNPITLTQRALVFGLAWGGCAALAVLLFDLLVLERGWCGHLCPVGAMYGVLGRASVLRVRADRRAACTGCGDCFSACPEPQVIAPALHGAVHGRGPVIASGDCIHCGRCIEVCDAEVFRFGSRFGQGRTLQHGNRR